MFMWPLSTANHLNFCIVHCLMFTFNFCVIVKFKLSGVWGLKIPFYPRQLQSQGRVFNCICFHMISQKVMQHDHQTWHAYVSQWVLESVYLGVKVKVTSCKKNGWRGSCHSCECWLLLVCSLIHLLSGACGVVCWIQCRERYWIISMLRSS